MPALSDAHLRIKPFDKAEFLRRVKAKGSSRDVVELYRRFLNSRTFDLWLYEKMHRTTDYINRRRGGP